MIPLVFRRIALAHELLAQDRPRAIGADGPASRPAVSPAQAPPPAGDTAGGCSPTYDPA